MPEIEDATARHRDRVAARESEAMFYFGRRRATPEEARDRQALERRGRSLRRFCPSCFYNDTNPLHGESLDGGETCKECGESTVWSIDVPAPTAHARAMVEEDRRIEREVEGVYDEHEPPARLAVRALVDDYGALGVVLTVLDIVGPRDPVNAHTYDIEILDAARLNLLQRYGMGDGWAEVAQPEEPETEPESVEPDTTPRWTLYEHPDVFNPSLNAWEIAGPDGIMIYGSCMGDQTEQLLDVLAVLNGAPLPPRAERRPPPRDTSDGAGVMLSVTHEARPLRWDLVPLVFMVATAGGAITALVAWLAGVGG